MNLLDLKEVAKRLDVHYDTARDFVVSGQLRSVRLAGRRKWQVREEDLEQFIEDSVSSGPLPGPKPHPNGPKIALDRRRKIARNTMPHEWRKRYAR